MKYAISFLLGVIFMVAVAYLSHPKPPEVIQMTWQQKDRWMELSKDSPKK